MDILISPAIVIRFLEYMSTYKEMRTFVEALWTDSRFPRPALLETLREQFHQLVCLKIHKLFPSDAKFVIDVLTEVPDTSLTGSFLLYCISDDDTWKPDDIDILCWNMSHESLDKLANLGTLHKRVIDPPSKLQNMYKKKGHEIKFTKESILEMIRDSVEYVKLWALPDSCGGHFHAGSIDFIVTLDATIDEDFKDKETTTAAIIPTAIQFIDQSFDFECCKVVYNWQSRSLKIKSWDYASKTKNQIYQIDGESEKSSAEVMAMAKKASRMKKYFCRGYIELECSKRTKMSLKDRFPYAWWNVLDNVSRYKTDQSVNIYGTFLNFLQTLVHINKRKRWY